MKKVVIIPSIAVVVLAAVMYFLLNQTGDSTPEVAQPENVLTDPHHPVHVELTENGFIFIDPGTGNPLEELSSIGGNDGEWVSNAHTSTDIPVMLTVRHGLPDRPDNDQWWNDAKVEAKTPTDYLIKPGESAQRTEIVDLRGAQIDPGDLRPQFASIYTPTTVMFVMHHPQSYDEIFTYYELWKEGNRVLVSESPVLFDSGLLPGTQYGYRITGSNIHPDKRFSESPEEFNASIYLRTPDAD